jgi:hypothetical protein
VLTSPDNVNVNIQFSTFFVNPLARLMLLSWCRFLHPAGDWGEKSNEVMEMNKEERQ